MTAALAHPKRPLVAIVAGSKVSTKLTILKALSGKVDGLIVGGGIANTFLLAAGLPIGKSLAEADLVAEAKAVIDAMKARGAEVPIPVDVVVAKEFKADAPATVKAAADVAADDLILDIGPKTAALLADKLKTAGTIVWNGPVGVFEFDAFAHGTETIARAIAASPAFSIAGGGDTLAAIAKYGIEKDISYISHRRRRLPGGAGGQDAAGVRDPGEAGGAAGRGLTTVHCSAPPPSSPVVASVVFALPLSRVLILCQRCGTSRRSGMRCRW